MKMDFKTILVVALIALAVFQYMKPEDSKQIIDSTIDKAKSVVGDVTKTKATETTNEVECEEGGTPVCVDGNLQYINSCFAKKAGHADYVMGSC
jgi:hypothetical protein